MMGRKIKVRLTLLPKLFNDKKLAIKHILCYDEHKA